jgi:esterase FrsA
MDDSLVHTFDLDPQLEIAYTGPDFSAGPFPALFYFALSAQDSLGLDPFNQPAAYLSSLPIRVFSITLPGHENHLPPTEALKAWAKEIAAGNNLIAVFVDKVKIAVQKLLERNVLISERMAVAGLSRGAFISVHVAAEIAEFKSILGFAPLNDLSFAKEFEGIRHHPLVESLKLDHLAPRLTDRYVRFYIGNLDTRVSTRRCFDFVEKLSESAFEQKIRSPQVELLIGPSIGRDGHGTSKEVFHQGAQWIAEKIGAIDEV